ncbi:acetyl-CoA carboxylase biotin carboxylase subunit [Mycobacterium sp. CBMA293]|uniref:acetyl-CoA carboxylase biotin carboxylase subunit n=1 Tax=unclassified Mycolicibacterium TaxID=2636767 RepID=UPI0013242CDC|nr:MULTISPECIES: acetyl-CoA carboxylase biotin carboxylase subunit [unclassified Mycolicibacterium]MUL46352.1 acetyl-CoA carboxylase biotin carboxylase subunit [Mycolicibacterium sp. CBMA 360]MUL92224.1 acetyl-CoA carboxylase biotin carboxylase subunit [Mycolicibacterium sp. CBMA 230]MUM34435.1 acetyl-CoA carboxylase biotin carboxylase subunit [Mycolicibacterium sp. CBMA 361]MUL57136.1 acetyl-CoA carboxylase biotin carboxylase subunit [Mycolicibacterium sp. CBMA 335]MUL70176.1 acetyl-CoA carbo
MFDKVLVANRGEIAVRVITTLRRLGIASVAVHSDIDAGSMHVRMADEAVPIGAAPVGESYLRIDRIIEAALATGAQAIHPGYGLLSENPEFARACAAAGLVFIGPSPDSMEMMSSKIRARETMAAAGVPVVPGGTEPIRPGRDAIVMAEAIGYPVAVKAASGGGGKGFRVARGPDELADAVEGASGEGERFFGDATVYLERYLDDPRHVEVQIIADIHGNTVHLFERDCSVQRRHQKLVEEAPCPLLTDAQRRDLGKIAVRAARAAGYYSLGTVEGLLVGDSFYFLEMNTRIQVEHPVTELVTGLDLVAEQIRIAAGEPLGFRQSDVRVNGHAIECRVNAESAAKSFRPGPGRIERFVAPVGDGVRVDTGVADGDDVHPYYDPLIAKVIAWGEDRRAATDAMRKALDETVVAGIPSLVPFHRALLASAEWERASTCRELIEDRSWLKSTDAWADGSG